MIYISALILIETCIWWAGAYAPNPNMHSVESKLFRNVSTSCVFTNTLRKLASLQGFEPWIAGSKPAAFTDLATEKYSNWWATGELNTVETLMRRLV